MLNPIRASISAIFIMFITTTLVAQPSKGSVDVSAGLGFISSHQLKRDIDTKRGHAYLGTASITYSAGGRYYPKKEVAIGLSISAQQLYGATSYHVASANFSYEITALVIGADLTIPYVVRRENFVFYFLTALGYEHYMSKVNSGNGFHNEKLLSDNMKMQVSPFGFRVGTTFGAYLELGYGHKGMISFGLCYSINTAKKRIEKETGSDN